MNYIREIFYSLRARAAKFDRNTANAMNRIDPVRALARNSTWSTRNNRPLPVKVVDNHPWDNYQTR